MKGKVYLVGAGPGDDRLITVKGLELIKKADVLIFDRLVNEKLLQYAPLDCEMIYVGKAPGNHTLNQDEINELLVDRVGIFETVVRLKGGDPYVFGRGSEEGVFLAEHGVSFEVVPGISSSIGGLAYAGIPVTHRGLSDNFHVYNGHSEYLDFNLISQVDGTLIFLMGVSSLERIINGLLNCGKSPETPVAIVSQATLPRQRTIVSTLQEIKEILAREIIEAPSLLVVGNVVELQNRIDFFSRKELFGKKIIVTRPKNQNRGLIDIIGEYGGEAIEIPVMEIVEDGNQEEIEQVIKNLDTYNYLIFSSINGVKIFFKHLFSLGYDCRILGNITIVAIGNVTAKSLLEYGLKADIVPESYVSESLIAELKSMLKSEDKVLLIGATDSRMFLQEEISKICSSRILSIYKKIKNKHVREKLINILGQERIDYLIFTSPSTVRYFLELLESESYGSLEDIKIISIGPTTSDYLRKVKLSVYMEAAEHNDDGLLGCLLENERMRN